MKYQRFSQERIIGILVEHQASVSVAELRSKHGVSQARRFTERDSIHVIALGSSREFPMET